VSLRGAENFFNSGEAILLEERLLRSFQSLAMTQIKIICKAASSFLSLSPSKMFLRIPILFLTFIFIASFACARQESYPFVAQVTSDTLNVRAGQSKNFEEVCQLQKGDSIIVVEKSYSWYKIKLPSQAKSFINAEYVQLLNDAQGIVTGDRVNVRAGANVNSTIIGQLVRDDKVQIFEKLDKWYRIAPTQASFGWVLEDYVSFKTNNVASYEPSKSQTTLVEKKDTVKVSSSQNQSNFISATGDLKVVEQAGVSQYQLMGDGQPTYNLSGLKLIFDNFLNYKIRVEGILSDSNTDQNHSSTIIVSKIKLLL